VAVTRAKPLASSFLEAVLSQSKLIISVEDHSIYSGIAPVIAQMLFDLRRPSIPRFVRMGIKDRFTETGEYHWLLDNLGLSPRCIIETVIQQKALCET